MKSILLLFGDVAGYIGNISLLFPIIASLFVRRKKIPLSSEMRLFEIFIYITFLAQLVSHSIWLGLTNYKDIILIIYLPIHTIFLSYLLIKWIGRFKKNLKISILIVATSLIINYFLNDHYISADTIYWFDTFILLILSVFLSYIRDKRKARLKCEYSYIHNGIYVSSLLTAIGISLPNLEIIFFGLFIHTIANIACNIYFARSFKCLYH